MQHFVYAVIFQTPILEIKLVVILLLVRVSQIGRKKKIQTHVGGPNSAHNQALSKCQDLLNQSQHIQTIFFKQSDQARIEYQARLNSSVDCVKSLLRQGYDGASNMQGEFNGLKTLILKENPCAYYPWQRIIIKFLYFSLWFLM
ncbi:hypothetical protein CsSME_00040530 [Camellia sinensis var. sinensis]